MACLPRLALATPAAGPEPSPAGLALLGALDAAGWRVQHFRSWACPLGTPPIGAITGLPGRHLDAWLMPPAVCRTVFVRGAAGVDLALVEGTLEAIAEPAAPPAGTRCLCRDHAERPGPLDPLIEALNLPCVAVVDCRGWDGVHIPRIPERADAVILDGLEDRAHFEPLRLMVRLVLGRPVLGAVEHLPAARAALAGRSLGRPVPRELVEPLARSFARFADRAALSTLARSRPLPEFDPDVHPGPTPNASLGRRFRVAFAMDEAFGGYYPDTLEALALLGADLVEFSPLRDEALPEGADLVMIGCGFPDRFAERLAGNLSLRAALQAHVCRGGRLYAEGGGAACLGRWMVVDGRPHAGAGIFPFDADLVDERGWPAPVERALTRDGWLGPRGTTLRGYRSGRWRLSPAPEPGDCPARSGRLTAEPEVFFRKNAIGSLIHLHLGALPQVVDAFAGRGPARPRPGTLRI